MSVIDKRDTHLRASGAASTRWDALWEWLVRPMHYSAVRRLRLAAQHGDGPLLASLLASDVAVVVQSGRGEPPRTTVVRGPRDATTLLLHGMTTPADSVVVERSVNGQAGLVVTYGGHPSAMLTVDFTGRLVSMIWVRLRPELLRHWNGV